MKVTTYNEIFIELLSKDTNTGTYKNYSNNDIREAIHKVIDINSNKYHKHLNTPIKKSLETSILVNLKKQTIAILVDNYKQINS